VRRGPHLVAYDVSDDRRRRRIAAYLETIGERRQASVFLVVCDPGRAKRLERRLRTMTDPATDRILVAGLRHPDAVPTCGDVVL
jgi:CRISPR-associated protein Cas2